MQHVERDIKIKSATVSMMWLSLVGSLSSSCAVFMTFSVASGITGPLMSVREPLYRLRHLNNVALCCFFSSRLNVPAI